MLSRSGYLTERNKDIESELTVSPKVNTDYVARSIPFKVFKKNKDVLCVPQHYGMERLGKAKEDTRQEPVSYDNIPFEASLKPELSQPEAVDAVMKSMRERGGAVLSLHAGFGKTICALKIASLLKKRTLIIVHKDFLANQWRQRIQQFCPGMSVGLIQQSTFDIEHPFVVGLLQTITLREFDKDSFSSFGLVVVDEAHHICAKVFSQSMFSMCPKYTLGLTATPERKDGLTNILYWFLGPSAFVSEPKRNDKAEVKFIRPELDIHKQIFPTSRFGKLSMPTAITMLAEDEERNKVILETIEELIATGRKVLVLADRREHCKYLCQHVEGSALYLGGMKEKDLDESATRKCIMGTFSMAQEGLDIGDIDTVFMVSPKSDVVQSIGRCMRAGGGRKNHSLIVDMRDDWGPFGSMYYKRRKTYIDLGLIDIKGKGQ